MQANTDRRLVWAVQLVLRVLVLCAVFQSFTLSAQCTLSCPSGLNLSIAGSNFGCASILTPADIGVIAPSCTGIIDLDLYTSSNQLLPGGTAASTARTGIVTSAHIGVQLRARVTHRASGNNCDVNLNIVDGLAPSLVLSDTTVSILQSLLPQSVGGAFEGPQIEDCTSTTSTYTDSVSTTSCTASAYAKTFRRWTVTDAFGNSSTASQVIAQVKVHLDSIEAPRDTSVSCAAGGPMGAAMGTPNVRYGGVVYTLPSLGGNQANLFWSYADETFAGGGGTSQILRSFRFYDACSPAVNGVNPRTLVQRISVIDAVAPVFSTTLDTLYYSTSTSTCEAVINLPALPLADDCTSVPSVRVQMDGQLLTGNGGFFGQLPLGTYTATYTATDSSSNSSTYRIVIVVRDQNPPVLITRSQLQISLPSNGPVVVFPTNFDQGSYDDCSSLLWAIRLGSDTAWSSSLLFDCLALGQEIEVEVQACDQFGNCNIRAVQVATYDYLPPVIVAPPNITLDCSVSDTSEALFGAVSISDNCTFSTRDSIVSSRDQCGVGQLQRYWFARDSSGNENSATQVISFVPAQNFTEADIVWPQDTSLSTCVSTDPLELPAGYSVPSWSTVPCSNIAYSHSDQLISGPSGVCEVLFRTWTVIDQCSFDGQSSGIWQHAQRIQLIDLDAPVLSATTDTVEVLMTIDSCGGGYFPANIFSSQDCSSVQSEIRFYDGVQLRLNMPYDDSSYFIPKGVDRVELYASDYCENVDSLSVVVRMVDAAPPIAACIDTLIYYLQSDSSVIDVNLIDLGSQDACGESLQSISSDFIASCNSIGWNSVALTVTDSAGLQSVCFTEVHVIDTARVCPLKSTTVFGRVATVNNHAIPTRFDLVGVVGDTVGTFYSELDGSFSFDVEFQDSVTVVPSSDYAPALFVSTYDLYLIGQHILGITEFSDPLKRFAGDGNRSRSISAFDMTLFRRLFLELSDALPHGTSVRFIPDTADLSLPDVTLTAGIPMFDAAVDSTQLSWHAIKLGDVSGTRFVQGSVLEGRSDAFLSLQWVRQETDTWSLEYNGTREVRLYGLGLWVNNTSVQEGDVLRGGVMLADTEGGEKAVSWLASKGVPLTLKQGASLLTVISKDRPRLNLSKSDAVVAFTDNDSSPVESRIEVNTIFNQYTDAKTFQVYPNPAKAGTLLRVRTDSKQISSLRLVNARGAVVELAVRSSTKASGLLPATLAPGIYALQGRYTDGRTFEQRILVSN